MTRTKLKYLFDVLKSIYGAPWDAYTMHHGRVTNYNSLAMKYRDFYVAYVYGPHSRMTTGFLIDSNCEVVNNVYNLTSEFYWLNEFVRTPQVDLDWTDHDNMMEKLRRLTASRQKEEKWGLIGHEPVT